jgi:hypothetical protein
MGDVGGLARQAPFFIPLTALQLLRQNTQREDSQE